MTCHCGRPVCGKAPEYGMCREHVRLAELVWPNAGHRKGPLAHLRRGEKRLVCVVTQTREWLERDVEQT